MKKHLGQVFTPLNIVNIMLKEIYNLQIKELLTKKILEPSFGKGIFILTLFKYYKNLLNKRIINENEFEILLSNIYGVELEDELYNETITLFKKELDNNYDIIIDNNFIKNNFLLYEINNFDYIIGNPPYVRNINMESETKNIIKNFQFNKGNIDLYIIFMEHSLNLLNDYGKLIFITPNTYLKSSSQKLFRKHILEKNYLDEIIEFDSLKIFENAQTYTAITTLNKNKKSDQILYYHDNSIENLISNQNLKVKKLNRLSLLKNNYIRKEDSFLSEINSKKNTLKDFIDIQYAFETNRNLIFVVKKIKDKNKTCIVQNGFGEIFEIEANILKKVIKGSTYNGIYKDTYIIFPYINNKIIPEECFYNNYEFACDYLTKYKKELEKRDIKSKSSLWYQFGRSQGFKNMYKEKIVFKNTINIKQETLEYFTIDKNTLIYSGVYITLKNNVENFKMKELLEILNSDVFLKYLKIVGKDMTGDYKGLSSIHLQNYKFDRN